MISLFYFLIVWFVYVTTKFIVKRQKHKNNIFSKWKSVNNWGLGGNSVRANVSGLFKK